MRFLMIGAHQGDNEFRCGDPAHKYVKMGYEVRYAKAFRLCPYGGTLTEELKKLFNL